MSGNCVETRWLASTVQLKDSKQDLLASQPMIDLSAESFQVFQDELLGLALEGSNGEIVVDRLEDGWVAFRSLSTGVTLRYDADEFAAFVEGVRAGEFRPVLASA